MFNDMIDGMKEEIAVNLFRIFARAGEMEKESFAFERRKKKQNLVFSGAGQGGPSPSAKKSDKVGRNDQCPCGSGKKFKKCCGKPQN